jgi:POT family proton-dependent oligopeptide transporter
MSPPSAPALTTPAVRDDRFPFGIPYIVGNEAAERFSYYGMRQILYIYLVGLFTGFVMENAVPTAELAEAKVRATQAVHVFMAGVYLFPMIGAILADRLLGKYRVIFWVSLIYVAGHAALAFAGRFGVLGQIGAAESAMLLGLALIAVGSGGIKPCVSANVGDQFTAANGHLVPKIFQIFYFTINFGSFFASVLTPVLYKQFGPEVAFGVPGVLMAIAAFVFWLGRKRFIRVPPKPGGMLGGIDFVASSLMVAPLLFGIYVAVEKSETIVHAVMQTGSAALLPALADTAGEYWYLGVAGLVTLVAGLILARKRQALQEDSGFLAVILYCWRHRGERVAGESFWEPARRHFGDEAAEGPPAVLRILFVFSMVSVFWALFDQHSSTWVEQAKSMNLRLVLPSAIWDGWVVPGTIAGAVVGALWLFLWVSNVRIPRAVPFAIAAAIALWGAGAGALHFFRPTWTTLDLLPAQISALNPLLVMIIIPLLSVCVYRPLERRGRPLRPLQRMTIGMALTALSFVAVALLQARIEAAGSGQVHVLWQIIPYTIITASEVLVSITGLEFAYTQAPRAMKSTIMGFWLLTVTLGNILVAFLAPLQTLSLTTFFWTFAGLMGVAALIFAIIASFYRGKSYLQSAE